MFIERPAHRKPAPVADSWNRVEPWYRRAVPDAAASLRPGASAQAILDFEEATGLCLPPDVKELYRIHDGQEESWPGVILCCNLDPLERVKSSWLFFKSLHDENAASDVDYGDDDDCTSYPPDAIRCQDVNPGWVPLDNWDGNCFGIDLDPGPNGVPGQVINFGRDQQAKYVVALSMAHFLEDIADELEAGGVEVLRDSAGEVTGVGRPGSDDQSFRGYIDVWSAAKLPREFQDVVAVPREPELPGDILRGEDARAAAAHVEEFIKVMHEYEQKWLDIHPIHRYGYGRIVDSPSGFCTMGLNLCGGDSCGGDAEEGPTAQPDRLELGEHRELAVRERNQIIARFCTERKRFMADTFLQTYPTMYDPRHDRIGSVRQLASDYVIVYLKPRDGVTVRFHLRKTGQQWRIDIKDKTSDHVRFEKVSF